MKKMGRPTTASFGGYPVDWHLGNWAFISLQWSKRRRDYGMSASSYTWLMVSEGYIDISERRTLLQRMDESATRYPRRVRMAARKTLRIPISVTVFKGRPAHARPNEARQIFLYTKTKNPEVSEYTQRQRATIEVGKQKPCEVCWGKGAISAGTAVGIMFNLKCNYCGGAGHVDVDPTTGATAVESTVAAPTSP